MEIQLPELDVKGLLTEGIHLGNERHSEIHTHRAKENTSTHSVQRLVLGQSSAQCISHTLIYVRPTFGIPLGLGKQL